MKFIECLGLENLHVDHCCIISFATLFQWCKTQKKKQNQPTNERMAEWIEWVSEWRKNWNITQNRNTWTIWFGNWHIYILKVKRKLRVFSENGMAWKKESKQNVIKLLTNEWNIMVQNAQTHVAFRLRFGHLSVWAADAVVVLLLLYPFHLNL